MTAGLEGDTGLDTPSEPPGADPDAEAAERRARVLAEYGDADAVMRPCERETALHAALRAFVMAADIGDMPKGSLLGWTGGSIEGLPFMVGDAVAQAVPMPTTVSGAWAELSYWRKLADDRKAIDPATVAPVWVLARRAVLAEILDTMPGPTFEDVQARLAWLQHALSAAGSAEQDQACLAQLRVDIEILASSADQAAAAVSRELPGPTASKPVARPASNSDSRETVVLARRTNVEKRSAVLVLLDQDLTDREIARRAGVSPQFVGNVRRDHADRDP